MKIDHLVHEAVQAFRRPADGVLTAKNQQAHRDADRRKDVTPASTSHPVNQLDGDVLRDLADQAAARLAEHGVSLKFRVDDATGDLQVEVLDANNEKVIRKIPPDELLKLSASLDELAGGGREGSFLNALF